MSQSATEGPSGSAAEIKDAWIEKRCPFFRVLIIGRANAGKTTVLQRICNTTEDPKIFKRSGEKVSDA